MKNQTSSSILKKHESSLSQLNNQAYNNVSKQAATKALEKIKVFKEIGNLYFDIIFYKLSLTIPTNYGKLFEFLQKKLNMGDMHIEYLVGYTLDQELSKIQGFKELQLNIKKGIQQVYKEGRKSQLFFSSDQEDTFYTQQYEKGNDKKNMYKEKSSKVQEKPGKSFLNTLNESFGSDDEIDVTFTMDDKDQVSLDLFGEEDVDYDSEYFKEQNQQVKAYLMKLSKATTQLSYLCQHMKWSQPKFQEKRSGVNDTIFEARTVVMVRSKTKQAEMSGLCPGAISKRQARRIASLFILKKIYNRFPEVWEKFSKIRSLNQGNQQPLNANNQQIFYKVKPNVMELSIFQNKDNKEQKNKQDLQLEKYLQSIKSYKNQINLLHGRIKKLSPPSMNRDLQDELGLWPVTAQMYYQGEQFKAKAKQPNKKKAQEKCCRDLLYHFYKKYKDVWHQFKTHKQLKNL